MAPVSFLLFCEVTRVVLRSDDNFLLVETQIEKETRIGWYGWNQRSKERERASSFLAGFGLERTLSARWRRCGERVTLNKCLLPPLTSHSRAPTLDLRGGLRESRETVRFDANFFCLHSLNRGFALASLAPCDCNLTNTSECSRRKTNSIRNGRFQLGRGKPKDIFRWCGC